jgi:hypothetical protein
LSGIIESTETAVPAAASEQAALRRFVAWGLRQLGASVDAAGGDLLVRRAVAVNTGRASGTPANSANTGRASGTPREGNGSSAEAAGEAAAGAGRASAWPDWLVGSDSLVLRIPPAADDRGASDAPSGVSNGISSETGADWISPHSRLVDWLAERLAKLPSAINAAPLAQPCSAGEIAERLLPAYEVTGGKIRLAGCALDDRAFFRIYARSPADSAAVRFLEWTIDADGRRVDEEVGASLRLGEIGPTTGMAPLPTATLADLTQLAERAATAAAGPIERLASVLLWCKYASGKLRIEFPSACAEIRFADWAATLSAPPFVCPLTGVESFRIATTDDGRIAAAEQIAKCEETGRRLLRRELVECSASGHLAAAELTEICPITERPVLRRLMQACEQCGERVGPGVIRDGVCSACHGLAVAPSSDPRISRVLGEFPQLDRWRGWRIAETATSYILVGAGLMKRLLLVLDRETLVPKRVATASRLRRVWTPVPAEQWRLELGSSEIA